jgi:pseudouridine synthase
VKERLQKILARAGYGSRRSSEAIVTAGRVRVNGAVAQELGAIADPEHDRIEVDGRPVRLATERLCLMMHKPAGYLSTASDPGGRATVMHLLPGALPPHVFPVGRLDRDTEGLLLFTNDGDLANRLAHPRYELEKEYLALVRGTPSQASLARLQRGVVIEGGRRTAPARVTPARAPRGHHGVVDGAWLQIVIHEGRKRQVRLMCAAVGHPVRVLVRTRVGPLKLGALRPGQVRRLTPREVHLLSRAVGL